jgi:DNA-binding MarR family transcriptional regulator
MADKESSTEELLQCVCFRLRKAARKVSQIYDHALEPFDLTNTQYSLLAHLPPGRGVSIGELALELGTDSTTLTRNLRPLERRRLIAVVRPPEDARVRLVTSTPAGQALFKKATVAWKVARKALYDMISPRQLEQLERGLDGLLEG